MLDNKEVQTTLKQCGLYHGAIDGILGPQSRAAIDAFIQGAPAGEPVHFEWQGWSADRRLIAAKQLILRAAGQDVGPIDGVLADRTRAAIMSEDGTPSRPAQPAAEGLPDLGKLLPRMWSNGKPALIAGIVDTYQTVFPKYQITSRLRTLHLMTQISAESGGGRLVHESLYYTTPGRLRAVWPSRFGRMSDAQLAPYLRNERELANLVYGARMGNERNGIKDDDGYFYRGRGLIQTTGLESYEWLAHVTNLPLIEQPDLVSHPDYALECATAEFVFFSKCLPYADRDNLLAVSGLINVGRANVKSSQIVGFAERQHWYNRWDDVL